MFSNRNLNILRTNCNKIKLKWACINCVRTKSSTELKTKTYSHTILSPKTSFPARSNNLKKDEIQKTAQFANLYEWQRENLTGPEFVLHDGPPYANGDLHMGHAVNKIIKDINNRSQVLQGNKVYYVPGWDCHGLPIELKALQKAQKTLKQSNFTDPVHIRQLARSFALETVDKQKAAFEKWGIMADWEKQCYFTLENSYIKKQLQQFYKMYKSGLIFRAMKPVYWSPSSKTALAESELVYDPNFKSTEVYMKFGMTEVPSVIKEALPGKISALIWTTTPWTLVANKAICFNPQFRYSVVTISTRPGELFVVGSGLIEEVEKALEAEIQKVLEFDGLHLEGSKYFSDLTDSTCPFLPGDHVTESKGTGLVHTAPAHGPEDFLVALKHNIDVQCLVDESGCYTQLDATLNGLFVLGAGQEAVLRRAAPLILLARTLHHSWPLDWRTRKPVFLRASRQWFISTERLKQRAAAALEKVDILPPSTAEQSRQGFKSLLERRPYWCISRQRAWGVPIPAVYSGDDVIVDERIIDRLASLMEEHGPDAWWTCDVTELVPSDVIKDHCLDVNTLEKGKDIMDIWLDSGFSWQTLDGKTADLYSEGVDQLTGWFQASLLTSIALNGEAPYKSIFVHGFVVDDKKRKMSKSIGNVVDPTTIIEGGKDRNNQPPYGVDTLRWWVASHGTQYSQIVISKKLLDDCQAEVIRIRNILKYLLAVISDVPNTGFQQKPTLNYFDSYIVKETYDFLQQINGFYNEFRYNNVAQSVLHFISNKVSGLYCHCVKDRLYCSPKDSIERLSAQLVVNTILVTLCKSLGPVLPHLVEEVWQHHPLYENPFYFTQNLSVLPENSVDPNLMDIILNVKRDICVEVKNENLKKFDAKIIFAPNLYEKINILNFNDGLNYSVLCEILEVSNVELEERSSVGKWTIEVIESRKSQCLRCRKYNAIDNSDRCLRCDRVMESM